jgi:hypothetical protein
LLCSFTILLYFFPLLHRIHNGFEIWLVIITSVALNKSHNHILIQKTAQGELCLTWFREDGDTWYGPSSQFFLLRNKKAIKFVHWKKKFQLSKLSALN